MKKGHWVQIRYLWGLQLGDSRRSRLRYIAGYLISLWDDMAYDRGWPDWAYAPEWGVLNAVARPSCWVAGHDPQLNDSMARYCGVCHKRLETERKTRG